MSAVWRGGVDRLLPSASSEEFTLDGPAKLFDYQLIGGQLAELIGQNEITSFAACTSYLFVGLSDGSVYQFNQLGEQIKVWQEHAGPVTSLVALADGSMLASGGSDGHLVFMQLNGETVHTVDTHSPVLSLAFGSPVSVFVGLECGVLLRCTYQTREPDLVLHQGEGAIRALAVREHLLAFTTSYGARIVDTETMNRVAFVPHESKGRPSLYWAPAAAQPWLVVGWDDSLTSVGLVEGSWQTTSTRLPGLAISEVSPADDMTVVLGALDRRSVVVVLDGNAVRAFDAPALAEPGAFLRAASEACVRVGELDALQRLFPPPETAARMIHYVVTRRSVVVAVRVSVLQRVQQLLHEGDVTQALRTVLHDRTRSVPSQFREAIGQRLILAQLLEGNEEAAARLCTDCLGDDGEVWEQFVTAFRQAGFLRALLPRIPTANPRLSRDTYTQVLTDVLAVDHALFSEYVGRWDAGLYDTYVVIARVIRCISQLSAHSAELAPAGGLTPLYKALFTLYDRTGQHVEAFHCLLLAPDLPSAEIFDYVCSNQLYEAMQEHIEELLRIDALQAVRLLAKDPKHLPPPYVIAQIQRLVEPPSKRTHALFAYLSEVGRIAPKQLSADNVTVLLGLTAEIDPDQLPAILQSDTQVNLPDALRVCRERGLLRPQVVVLQRMGTVQAHREALEILVGALGETEAALQYVQRDEGALWPILLPIVRAEKTFYRGAGSGGAADAQRECFRQLFRYCARYLSPSRCVELVNVLPPKLDIDGLRETAGDMFRQYRQQARLFSAAKETCQDSKFVEYVYQQKSRGILLPPGCQCDICRRPVLDFSKVEIDESSIYSDDYRVFEAVRNRAISFRCGHSFHGVCLFAYLSDHSEIRCPLCTQKQLRKCTVV